MAAIIVEHKCITCKYFDYGDNECTKRVECLNFLNEYQVISECDSWAGKEEDNEK